MKLFRYPKLLFMTFYALFKNISDTIKWNLHILNWSLDQAPKFEILIPQPFKKISKNWKKNFFLGKEAFLLTISPIFKLVNNGIFSSHVHQVQNLINWCNLEWGCIGILQSTKFQVYENSKIHNITSKWNFTEDSILSLLKSTRPARCGGARIFANTRGEKKWALQP